MIVARGREARGRRGRRRRGYCGGPEGVGAGRYIIMGVSGGQPAKRAVIHGGIAASLPQQSKILSAE